MTDLAGSNCQPGDNTYTRRAQQNIRENTTLTTVWLYSVGKVNDSTTSGVIVFYLLFKLAIVCIKLHEEFNLANQTSTQGEWGSS